MLRLAKKVSLVAGCVLLLAGLASTPALAASPWWHLTLGAAPTNLSGSAGKDEVQQLTVSATAGDYLLVERNASHVTVVPFDATTSQVQQHLEAIYPSRELAVNEQHSTTVDTRTFTITFPSQAVEPALALADTEERAENFGGEPLSGGKEEVSLTELEQGVASENKILLMANNLGDTNIEGGSSPVVFADRLPAGLKAVAIEGVRNGENGLGDLDLVPLECSLAHLQCSFDGKLAPYGELEVTVAVVAEPDATSGEDNEGTVSGGGAAAVSATRTISVGGSVGFGVESYEMAAEEEGGAPVTQAGAHPFQLTTQLTFDAGRELADPPALPKDVHIGLPPGLVGNSTVLPQCTEEQFLSSPNEQTDVDECPADTTIGVASVRLIEQYQLGLRPVIASVPVFNLKPEFGEPARFGFYVTGVPTVLDTAVRTGGDYGVTVSSNNIPQKITFLSSTVTFWGVPDETSHDDARGWGCVDDEFWHHVFPGEVPACVLLDDQQPIPFLQMPSSCTGPMPSSIEVDSWQEHGQFQRSSAAPLPGLTGCGNVPFAPSLEVKPDSQDASTPSGLTVRLHVPQEESLNPSGLAEADVKDTTVALPEGLALNPAAADGLLACAESQIGLEVDGGSSCPEASKVGTVKITTPLLPKGDYVEGAAYLATQNANPFGSLVALYVSAEDPVSGTIVKLAGEVSLDPVTGRLVTTFSNTPQLPFEEFELKFFGGDRAPLATPAHCGTYTTDASITPWSAETNQAPVRSTDSFAITAGPNGGPCPGSVLPFNPSLTAQSSNIQAGGFTPFTTTISREDGQQNIESVTLHTPAGLSGILTGVPLCAEAQANAGTCPQSSLVGHTIVSVGLGGDPYTVTGGEVFLTEKIAGSPSDAPFGLSIVNPAVAGPFNLGKVIVRARIEVDPHTAALTITTGEIPHILDGIPLQIKHINVTIDRNGFIFNPTSCNPTSITGNVGSVEGASSPVSTPFQVTNCANLEFPPKFAASTSGKTSKADGASLTVKLSYPKAPQGTQANIAKVKVDLPKQLPSRLTTLQKACLAKVFEANPANCPKDSEVGHAKAITPILPVPLEGPAYFVSHGGEAFPSLIVVLKGYGVTVDLVGTTFISKAGITSSTFKSVPDVPVSSFELTLPEGKYSALAANLPAKDKHSFCGTKLAMPTAFVAQNGGAEIHESTPIAISGCAKTKQQNKKSKKSKKKRKQK